MVAKKLLVYIPSYNRAERLINQLKAILQSDSADFDVIVSDNCSTDLNGYLKVQEYCAGCNVKYVRNAVNVGADVNIVNAYLLSLNYEYLWVLSDDDAVLPGVVDFVVNNVYGCDFLFFTHSNTQKNDIETWGQSGFFLKANLFTGDGAGLISYVVYKTDILKNQIPVAYNAVNTCFPHLALILQIFKERSCRVRNFSATLGFSMSGSLPPANVQHYSKSYFGYLLLVEYISCEYKKEFIYNFCSLKNLDTWIPRSKVTLAFQNYVYARAVLEKYYWAYPFFCLKIIYAYRVSQLYNFVVTRLSRNTKDRLKKLIRK